jgi:hypothetical protein
VDWVVVAVRSGSVSYAEERPLVPGEQPPPAVEDWDRLTDEERAAYLRDLRALRDRLVASRERLNELKVRRAVRLARDAAS